MARCGSGCSPTAEFPSCVATRTGGTIPWIAARLTPRVCSVNCVRIHNKLAISASDDRTIRLWDCEKPACTMVFEGMLVRDGNHEAHVAVSGHLAPVMCLQWSHNTIVSGSLDHTLKVWKLTSPHAMKTLFGHTAGILALQFDYLRTVTAAADRSIKVWSRYTLPCGDDADKAGADLGCGRRLVLEHF
jgi:WD40 repeat protein